MATSAPAACAPEVVQQIRRSLVEHPVDELGALTSVELHSLAALICALHEPSGAFRAQFERLNRREDLVALAATRGIPVEPSLLERFERLVGVGEPQDLGDRELAAITAGVGCDRALQGLVVLLRLWPGSSAQF
jgi:hypothetical protein